MAGRILFMGRYFNPLSLCRERPPPQQQSSYQLEYFNPLSLCRERRLEHAVRVIQPIFQSTLPLQGETQMERETIANRVFQSTLPLQGETHSAWERLLDLLEFQSTLPLQGETLMESGAYRDLVNFNPLSLCRERR